MEILKINKVNEPESNVKANVVVKLDDGTIMDDLKVVDGADGMLVVIPNEKDYYDKDFFSTYDKQCEFEEIIMQAYKDIDLKH